MNHPRIGRKYGLLTVIEKAQTGKSDIYYTCACDCGGTTVARWKALITGRKASCGCLVKVREERFAKTKADGLSLRKHPLGNTYRGMIKRCTYKKHPNYKYYGGVGVTVCDRWLHSFQAFVDDMGEKPTLEHTLDRIDFRGNYEPKNCRWATVVEQAENTKRGITVCSVTLDGVTKTLAAWGRLLGLSENVVASTRKIIINGETPEIALATAVLRRQVWASGGVDYSKCREMAEGWVRTFDISKL